MLGIVFYIILHVILFTILLYSAKRPAYIYLIKKYKAHNFTTTLCVNLSIVMDIFNSCKIARLYFIETQLDMQLETYFL